MWHQSVIYHYKEIKVSISRGVKFAAQLILSIMLGLLLVGHLESQEVEASVSSCASNVTPHILRTNTVANLFFEIQNTDPNNIVWVKMIAPSTSYEIFTGSATGWSRAVESQTEIRFYNGTLASGNTYTFTVTVQTGVGEESAADWEVQVSDESGGANPYSCSGNNSVAISDDSTGPSISNVSVSNITANSARVIWTTDEDSDSKVEYGETTDYGEEEFNGSLTTSHSVDLSGLSADMTYHFMVTSVDAFSNSSSSSDNTFTTAPEPTPTSIPTSTPIPTATPIPEATTTPAPGVTVTVGPTPTSAPGFPTATPVLVSSPTPSPTPRSIINQLVNFLTGATPTPVPRPAPVPAVIVSQDQIAPEVMITADFSVPYSTAPEIQGEARDNELIVNVEYSTDNGQNWLPVNVIEIADEGKFVKFSFTPGVTEDDNYAVVVRALDPTGNDGRSATEVLVIDRIPPRVGTSISSVGPQQLLPDANGVLTTVVGLDQTIIVSSAGGATQIDLLAHRVNEFDPIILDGGFTNSPDILGNQEQVFSLVKNPASGLWKGKLGFTKPGIFSLQARARDGAANETIRDFGTIAVLANGTVLSEAGTVANAVMTVHYFEPTRQKYVVWDARPFGQTNPQQLNEDGVYQLMLPPGKFFFQVKAFGYKTLKSNIMEISETTPVNIDLVLEKTMALRIGSLTITVPFLQTQTVIDPTSLLARNHLYTMNAGIKNITSKILEKPLPFFVLEKTGSQMTSADLRGRPTVITFLSNWSETKGEQLAIINELSQRPSINVIVVIVDATKAQAELVQQRGEYQVAIYADRDSELIGQLGLDSTPSHVFVDRRGDVQKIKVGVLNENELLSNIDL